MTKLQHPPAGLRQQLDELRRQLAAEGNLADLLKVKPPAEEAPHSQAGPSDDDDEEAPKQTKDEIIYDLRQQLAAAEKKINELEGASQLNMFLLAALGWTPSLWKHVQDRNWFKAAGFFFLSIVDLADAVIDVVLAVQEVYYGSEGSEGEGGLGILLFVMTILGRILSGYYGVYVEEKNPDDDNFITFAMMEMGVFFMEDGAAILLLAKNTGGMDLIEGTSTYLTVICGLFYIWTFVKFVIRHCVNGNLFDWSCVDVVLTISVTVLAVGGATCLMYILATEVVFARYDDPPLSGKLEVAAYVVYGITSFFIGGTMILVFAGIL